MNILLIDCDFGPMPGHNVRHIQLPSGGIVSIFKFLGRDENGDPFFKPDLLVQREKLGPRIFLRDLEKVTSCCKVFWAVDSHLNSNWHTLYARLFDVLLTPHPSIFKRDPNFQKLPPIYNFPFPGIKRDFVEFDQRPNKLAFVGRINDERRQRQTFAKYLQRFNCLFRECAFNEMLDLYSQTQILPNESIAQEFNFRIMEGASCGCCVLTEDIGDDLAANFVPGQEVLTYKHIQELDELIKFCLAKPKIAAAIGRAAWQKVQQAHLPEARRDTLFKVVQEATQHDGKDDLANFALATSQWIRSNPKSHANLPTCLKMLARAPQNPEVQNMRLRVLAEQKDRVAGDELFGTILARIKELANPLEDLETCVALYAYALLSDSQDLMGKLLKLLNFADRLKLGLKLAWQLLETGRISQTGFIFQTWQSCPQTAMELLLTLGELPMEREEKDLWNEVMQAVFDKSVNNFFTAEFQANLCMYYPNKWQTSFNLAYSMFKTYMLEAGLKELKVAYDLANSQGQLTEFQAMLRDKALHL